MDLSRREDLIIVVLFILFLISSGLYFYRQNLSGAGELEIPLVDTEVSEEEVVEEGKEEIVVHLTGQVRQPGVYYLSSGSRVIDLISEAGGPTRKAALNVINLAAPLYDGQQVYLPLKGEEGEEGTPGAAGSASSNSRVNLNQASPEELEELPGVGPSKAQAIIDYRKDQGHFSHPEELIEVRGIGEKTFEHLESVITVY